MWTKTLQTVSSLLILVAVAINVDGQGSRGGIFSHAASSTFGVNAGVIPSPDGKRAIVIDPPSLNAPNENHPVSVRWNGHQEKTEIGRWVNSEIEWSADSSAFFVTYTDGDPFRKKTQGYASYARAGEIGTYRTKIFYLTPSGLRIIEPIPDGRMLLSPKCTSDERPNVGGVKWVGQDSSLLLIAIEVPPHSSCASMGTFKVFEIKLPEGTTVTSYDQLAAKRRFSNALGEELRAADDNCIRTPESCVPEALKKGAVR